MRRDGRPKLKHPRPNPILSNNYTFITALLGERGELILNSGGKVMGLDDNSCFKIIRFLQSYMQATGIGSQELPALQIPFAIRLAFALNGRVNFDSESFIHLPSLLE